MNVEELISCFEFVGQNPTNIILEKCLEICREYGIDAEGLVEHWSSYSMTFLNDAAISLEGLTLMEQRILQKQCTNTQQELTTTKTHREDIYSESSDKLGKHILTDNASPTVKEKHVSKSQNLINEHLTRYGDSEEANTKNRTGSKILASFGNDHNPISNDQPLNLFILTDNDWYKPQHFLGLYTTQARIANSMDNKIQSIGRLILRKHNLEISKNEGDTVVYGRIKSEDGNKVNNKTVIMETSRDFGSVREIGLNISNCEKYSIFSGQVVAVKGVVVSKDILMVEKIYSDASPDFMSEVPSFNEKIQIVVAAGPFSVSDKLDYEPLQDLLKDVTELKPNVLILMGPFIDNTHSNILDIAETFEDHFAKLIKDVMDCLIGWPVQVVLIPSFNDAHHLPIYPTPCYELQDYPNLICAPNPCLLNINGFIVGTTSVDVLFQLTKEEISRNVHTDRMSRLANHLLQQRSFFPLYPNRDASICTDYERLGNDCLINVKPHLLILPSTLRYFIKNVDNCLVVNPERLAKNQVAGTYAIINICPPSKAGNMIDNISCEIRTI